MKKWQKYIALFSDVSPSLLTMAVIVMLMVAESAVSLLSPWLAGRFTEALLSPSPTTGFTYDKLLLFWLFILAIKGLLNFFNNYFTGKTSLRMLTRLQIKLSNHLQMLPVSYYHEKKHGKVLALLTNDATIISNFVTQTLVGLLPLFVTVFGALVCIYFIHPVICLLAAILVPLFYLITKLLGRPIRPLSRSMIEEHANSLAIVEENLAILPIIKSFTREEQQSKKYEESNERLLQLTIKYIKIQSFLAPLTKFCATAVIFLILWIISEDLLHGRLSSADMVSLMLYGMLITQPISGLANIYGQIQRTIGATDRLHELFSTPTESTRIGKSLDSVRGDIGFHTITFGYPDRPNILTDLSLKIQAGETIAITGENGAGKSTLVHLLMRFIDPQKGHISIDGKNINDFSLTSLRRHIGLVQQQVFLQNTTIAENILFGRENASQKQVELAARKAHAAKFIDELPDGYNTVIGDLGVKLSGGQKQRLALARVLLKDPAILILDEATAMFDPDGELAFIKECQELLQEKTVILITHRPCSLAMANTIYLLENGQLHRQAKQP